MKVLGRRRWEANLSKKLKPLILLSKSEDFSEKAMEANVSNKLKSLILLSKSEGFREEALEGKFERNAQTIDFNK